MKNGINESKQPPTSHSLLAGVLYDAIVTNRLPPLIRETIQFYLKHIAVFKARVLDNNRITIPKEEVEILNIKTGDYVAVILTKIEGVKASE